MALFPSTVRCCTSVILSLITALYGVRRKSLDLSGGVTAIFVGCILTAANGCFFLALLTFFLTSSRLTKWKTAEKKKLEHEHKEGGQRNWIQVICNGGVATIAALCYIASGGYGERPFYLTPSIHTFTALACISSLSCSCGDTWASEVGLVIGGTPRLITTWRRVPRGTNGGVTLIGVVYSCAGGLVVGVAYFLGLMVFVGFDSLHDAMSQSPVIVLGGVAGLFGSLIDSLLGATVQYSGYSEKGGCVVHVQPQGGEDDVKHISGIAILDNHAVNFVSSLITAIAIPLCLYAAL